MNIHLERPDHAALDVEEFLALSGNALMHYTPKYLGFLSKILANTKIAYLLARHNGAIEGVLPVAIGTDEKLGTIINSLPFFGSHGGPLVSGASADMGQIRLELMHGFNELVDEHQAISATLIENPFHILDDDMVSAAGISFVDDRIGQFTRLPKKNPDLKEALFAACHVKTRNAIRKGQKYEQRVARRTDTAAIKWLQSVHEQSIQALGGVAKPLHIFQALIDSFGDKARLYIGELDNLPVSGLLVILYGDTVEYFTPVVEAEHKQKQLLSSLIFSVMTELAQEGFCRWNWGGTWRSQTGVYRFKQRWGAEDYPYRYFNRLVDPTLISQSKDKLARAFPFFYLFKY
ncbi:MAG: GNAT family N-acetyltransferase [Cyanobacteria bacterium P01_A01_bin.137]